MRCLTWSVILYVLFIYSLNTLSLAVRNDAPGSLLAYAVNSLVNISNRRLSSKLWMGASQES